MGEAGRTVTLLLALAAIAPAAVAVAGMIRPRLAPVAAIVSAAAAFLLVALGVRGGGGEVAFDWVPSWGIQATLRLDGLGALYALLATGIGLVVLVYSSAYMPIHLHHEHRPERDGIRFWVLMTGFMGAMVWLALGTNLMLLFVAWDATAVASYFLIGFDHEKAAARRAALMALVVTGVSAIGILVGSVMLWTRHGTLDIDALAASVEPGIFTTVAVALIAVGALAKSAQVPLHFWLPRAMAAPTPVSSYLHSAAMVAAGVYLLARVYPLLAAAPQVREALVVVGFASMAVGGVLALGADEFKRLLAYSTIAQYGYVVVMLGIGGKYGVAGAALYVLAHALGKCGLFLTAGAATEATGEKALSKVGGLGRSQPALAIAAGACAATIAALPLTIGFFKDEAFFTAALGHGAITAALATVGAASTFAYILRFWSGIFLGSPKEGHGHGHGHAVPWLLVAPVAALGALAVIGGVAIGPFADLASAAGGVSLGEDVHLSLAYHLDARPENLMALAAWGLGLLLWLLAARARAILDAVAAAGKRIGPEHGYERMLGGLNALSTRLHAFEVHDLRSRVATLLVPAGILVALVLVFTPNVDAWRVGAITQRDIPILLVLLTASLVGLAACFPRDHLAVALLLSGVGYSLTVFYALNGAPDVALVAVLVETLFSLLFLGVLAALPGKVLRRARGQATESRARRRDIGLAIVSGIFAFFVAWGVLSRPAPLESAADGQEMLAPAAHARDVVTAVLADFRGLDTMGEISVIGIALLGLMTLLRRESAR